MNNDPLHGPRIKIRRANHQIDQAWQEIAAFFKKDPYAIVEEREAETGQRLLKIKLTERLPDTVLLLVPEAIYHLRSTLDQLMVALARRAGVKNVSHIYFPFGETVDAIERATQTINGKKGKLAGIPLEAQQMVMELEPYKGGNDDLWGLNRLSNVDKHLDLVPLGSINTSLLMSGLHLRNAGIELTGENRLDTGITIIRLGEGGSVTGLHDKANIQIAPQVAFGDVDVFSGKPVIPTLRRLSQLTEGIVDTFAARCFGT
ncbi:MAG: hypothetical protein AB7E55_03270 [Pigmentiphaga sp.]